MEYGDAKRNEEYVEETESSDCLDKREFTIDNTANVDTSSEDFEKTPDWILNDVTVRYNRSFNRVTTLPVLEIAKKTEFPGKNKILKMSLLSQWPKNPFGLVLFELTETKSEYEQMEEDMLLFYNNRLSNRAYFPDLKIAYGMHVVYVERMCGKLIYKRAKIIKTVYKPGQIDKSVDILLVDYNYNITVNSKELLFLYEQFSTLPPRAYKFKLEGMKSYKKYFSYKRLLHHDSGIWSETIEVTKSNDSEKGVIIYSDVFPSSRFPYGVNGFIILRLIEELKEPVLSEISSVESKAFIVYAKSNAEIFIQFPTPFYCHYSKLWKKMLRKTKQIKKKAGKITLPVNAETILLAPHYNSGGSYYRAVCIQPEVEPSPDPNNKTQIKVKFLEYGNEAVVNVGELVLAEDINYFLSILPPMAVPAKLAEIDTLNTNRFWQLLDQNISYTVKVCNITSDGRPEVKLLQYKRCRLDLELKMLHLDNSLLENIEEPSPMGRYCIGGPIDPNCTVPHDILSNNGLGKECRRLRVGMDFTFIVQQIQDSKTVSLYTFCDSHPKLMKIEKEMEDNFPKLHRLIPHKTTCAKGNYFMVKSRILGKVVRAMMLGLSKSKRYDIEVLLVDYGIREEVLWAESCRSLRVWEHCMLPSYGVVATIRNEDTELMKFMECLEKGNQIFIAGKLLSVKNVDSIPSVEIKVLKSHVEK